MNLIASVLAAIGLFFTNLLQPYAITPPSAGGPADGGTASFSALPAATPTYQTAIYQNATLNYQFNYPANTVIETFEDVVTIKKITFMLQSGNFTKALTPSYLLKHDHWCDADGPVGPGIHCTNTAVRPFTNAAGTEGYLVKRTKDMRGEMQQDWVYIFPRPNIPDDGVTMFVDEVTPSHLEVLDTIASSFTWK